MLIRDNSAMEKAMSIVYEDIVKARQDLERKTAERLRLLRCDAANLLNEYRESLSLPGSFWTDKNDKKRAYIDSGILSDDGGFRKSAIAALTLDDDYRLNFLVSTVVNDHHMTGGDAVVIPVSLHYEKDVLHVEVNGWENEFLIANQDAEGAYFEVCAAIKGLIILQLSDYRLE